jgi:hypothetical protein
MLQRSLSSGLCLAGLCLAGFAAVGYWTRGSDIGVTFEDTEADAKVGGPNEETVVVFWALNPTGSPARVIGEASC